MILPPPARKSVLAVHLTVSVGWIGSVLAYLALGLQAANTAEVEVIRGSWVAMETIGWTVIVPLAVAALVTGIVMAMGTRWRLLDHYWVVFSLVLTAAATVVLMLHMGDVEVLAEIARTGDDAAVRRWVGICCTPSWPWWRSSRSRC